MGLEEYTKEKLWLILVETVHSAVMYPAHKSYTREEILSENPDTTPAELAARLNMPFGELGGDFNVDLKSLQWSAGGMPVATGNIKWKNAKLTVAETVDLGQVELNIKPDIEGVLTINISNKNGDLNIKGKASVTEDKRYAVDVNFNPKKNASANIKQSLAMFARRQSNGSFRFKKNGNLNQLGL